MANENHLLHPRLSWRYHVLQAITLGLVDLGMSTTADVSSSQRLVNQHLHPTCRLSPALALECTALHNTGLQQALSFNYHLTLQPSSAITSSSSLSSTKACIADAVTDAVYIQTDLLSSKRLA